MALSNSGNNNARSVGEFDKARDMDVMITQWFVMKTTGKFIVGYEIFPLRPRHVKLDENDFFTAGRR